MIPAILRCNEVYNKYDQKCGIVTIHGEKAPFVTPECPEGYLRYGCCKCVKKCLEGN